MHKKIYTKYQASLDIKIPMVNKTFTLYRYSADLWTKVSLKMRNSHQECLWKHPCQFYNFLLHVLGFNVQLFFINWEYTLACLHAQIYLQKNQENCPETFFYSWFLFPIFFRFPLKNFGSTACTFFVEIEHNTKFINLSCILNLPSHSSAKVFEQGWCIQNFKPEKFQECLLQLYSINVLESYCLHMSRQLMSGVLFSRFPIKSLLNFISYKGILI